MFGSNNIKNIEQNIKEATLELTTPEYVEFMRELSVWAENEANVAEYEPDFEIDEWHENISRYAPRSARPGR